MLAHMLAASITRRKSRVAIVFAAIVIGMAISSGLASVYYDVGQKMSRELRTYGANLVLAPSNPEQSPYIRLDDVSGIAKGVEQARLVGYAPYLYGVVSLQSHQVVAVGTHFDQIEKVSPYWKITGTMPVGGLVRDTALVGRAVAAKLGTGIGDRIRLTSAETSRTREVLVGGILSTGGEEDSQVFVDLDVASDLIDKPGMASVAYFSVVGGLLDLEAFASDVQAEFPGVAASPIKRISQSEGQVLGKITSLVFLAVALILLLTILCVGITMTNVALGRRREIGLRKALGAQDRDIMVEFLGEGSVLGLTGGLLGWALGLPFAQAVGQSVFQSSVSIRPEVLPLAVLFSGGLAALASFLPARAAAGVEPALTLRGE